jgi:hypothetical protein
MKKLLALAIAIILICSAQAMAAVVTSPYSTFIKPKAVQATPMLNLFPDLWSTPNDNSAPQKQASVPAGDPFSLSISGNVYYDKIPVSGAEVSIYVNNKLRGKAVFGDLYMFKVPGVRMGDIIEIVAKYDGHTGSANDVVRLRNMYLDVQINSGSSFIRRALEILPTQDELKQAENLGKQQSSQSDAQKQSDTQQKQQQLSGSQATATPKPSATANPQQYYNAKKINQLALPAAWQSLGQSLADKLQF